MVSISLQIKLLPYLLLVPLVMTATNLNSNSQSAEEPSSRSRPSRSVPRETSVASAPVLFPQQQTGWPLQKNQQLLQQQPNVRWSTASAAPLREPANFPSDLTQEDAKHIEQYMRDFPRFVDGTDQTALNLASINDRSSISNQMGGKQHILRAPGAGFANPIPLNAQLHPPTVRMQSDNSNSFAVASSRRNDDDRNQLARRGKVDNVVNAPLNAWKSKFILKEDLKRLVHSDKLPPGCIARSVPHATRCEDHLIKRLNQDATEGRTVIDVTRRVCCALFWHKDCISRVIIEVCPDSSPPAADILLGARNLDLTLSCQRFNRDGCNGSIRGVLTPPIVLLATWLFISTAYALVHLDIDHARA